MKINKETGHAPSLFVWSPPRLAEVDVSNCVLQSHVVETQCIASLHSDCYNVTALHLLFHHLPYRNHLPFAHRLHKIHAFGVAGEVDLGM